MKRVYSFATHLTQSDLIPRSSSQAPRNSNISTRDLPPQQVLRQQQDTQQERSCGCAKDSIIPPNIDDTESEDSQLLHDETLLCEEQIEVINDMDDYCDSYNHQIEEQIDQTYSYKRFKASNILSKRVLSFPSHSDQIQPVGQSEDEEGNSMLNDDHNLYLDYEFAGLQQSYQQQEIPFFNQQLSNQNPITFNNKGLKKTQQNENIFHNNKVYDCSENPEITHSASLEKDFQQQSTALNDMPTAKLQSGSLNFNPIYSLKNVNDDMELTLNEIYQTSNLPKSFDQTDFLDQQNSEKNFQSYLNQFKLSVLKTRTQSLISASTYQTENPQDILDCNNNSSLTQSFAQLGSNTQQQSYNENTQRPLRKDTLEADEILDEAFLYQLFDQHNDQYHTEGSSSMRVMTGSLQLQRNDSLFDSPENTIYCKESQIQIEYRKTLQHNYNTQNHILISNYIRNQVQNQRIISQKSSPTLLQCQQYPFCKSEQTYLDKFLGNNSKVSPDISNEAYIMIQNEKSFITLKERIAVSDWMAQFCAQQGLQRHTYYLAISLFDRVLDKLTIERKETQKDQQRLEALSIGCMFIACKFEEIQPPSLFKMHQCIRTSTADQLINVEKEILQLLGFEVIKFTNHEILTLMIREQKDLLKEDTQIKSQSQESLQQQLECEEYLFDNLTENNLTRILDLIKLDLKASTFPVHILSASLFYLVNILLEKKDALITKQKSKNENNGNAFWHEYFLQISKDNSLRTNQVCSALFNKLFGLKLDYSLIEETFKFLIQYIDIITSMIQGGYSTMHIEEEGIVSQDSQLNFIYSSFMRPEASALILNLDLQNLQDISQSLPAC
eukprot:403363683